MSPIMNTIDQPDWRAIFPISISPCRTVLRSNVLFARGTCFSDVFMDAGTSRWLNASSEFI